MKPHRAICISLPSDVIDRIDGIAAEQERPRSQVIARLVRRSIPQIGEGDAADRPGGVDASHHLARHPHNAGTAR